MPKNEEELKKMNKQLEKNNNSRRSLFGSNSNLRNKISKNQSDMKREINKENKNINSALFGGYENTVDQFTNTENDSTAALQQKLDKISEKFKGTIGSNPMDFLNRIEMDKGSSDNSVLAKKSGENSRIKRLESLLKNSNGEFFLEEKDRFFRYEDYRLIDAYIPEVSKCLDLFRDCIMSPDDITKRSLTYFYDDENIEEDANNPEYKFIKGNLETLEKTYSLTKTIRNDIREGCLIGDLFYLLMPYDKGFTRILKEDELFVNDSLEHDTDAYGERLSESMLALDNDEDFKALFEEITYLSDKSDKAKEYKNTIERSKQEILDSINNNVKFFKDPTDLLSEKKQEANKTGSKNVSGVNINGSIFKKLAPENIVVLEIDKQILGYIYIEKNNINLQQNRQSQRNANPNSLRSGNTGSSINTTDSLGYGSNDVFNSRYDYLNRDQSQIKSKYTLISSIFVKGISKKVNKDFLKRNQEFKDLIYSLVHEEYITKKEVKMTFIEPQYIHHFKLSSNEIYGISKMSKSLFFSKIYLSVLLTNLMQKIIRGRDKRAFYIDVGLDDDLEGAVQGFIKDIKSKELSSGHLKSITTILNSVGAFEDYYIPTVDGSRSVEIDTVPGMDIDIDNEFMQFLLKSIITGMNVPYNYIDSTSEVDFARTLTMTNNPFVRAIINDQEDFGKFYSNIIRELYKYEFIPINQRDKKQRSKVNTSDKRRVSVSIDIDKIELRFPTPIYLVLGNTNEQIGNAQQTIDFLTSYYFPDDPTGENNNYANELKKANFRRSLARKCFLPTLDWDTFDHIYEDVKKKEIEDAIKDSITFNPEAKKGSELDTLEEDEDF